MLELRESVFSFLLIFYEGTGFVIKTAKLFQVLWQICKSKSCSVCFDDFVTPPGLPGETQKSSSLRQVILHVQSTFSHRLLGQQWPGSRKGHRKGQARPAGRSRGACPGLRRFQHPRTPPSLPLTTSNPTLRPTMPKTCPPPAFTAPHILPTAGRSNLPKTELLECIQRWQEDS